jgi:shikimate kinase
MAVQPPLRIFLVGLSGSGKSTAGPLAAAKLGWAFADSDRIIEEREGRTVAEIFAGDGEERFRAIEADVLEELARADGMVAATGGGAPTTARGRSALASGVVIWLDASPPVAADHIASSPGTEERPLLGDDPAARLQKLFWEREDAYRRADFSVDVDTRTPEDVADAIVACWGRAIAGEAPDPAFSTDRLDLP